MVAPLSLVKPRVEKRKREREMNDSTFLAAENVQHVHGHVHNYYLLLYTCAEQPIAAQLYYCHSQVSQGW